MCYLSAARSFRLWTTLEYGSGLFRLRLFCRKHLIFFTKRLISGGAHCQALRQVEAADFFVIRQALEPNLSAMYSSRPERRDEKMPFALLRSDFFLCHCRLPQPGNVGIGQPISSVCGSARNAAGSGLPDPGSIPRPSKTHGRPGQIWASQGLVSAQLSG